MERNYGLKQKLYFEKLGSDEDKPQLITVTVNINSNHVLTPECVRELETHYNKVSILDSQYKSVQIVRNKVVRD